MTLYTVTITGLSTPVEVYGGLPAAKDYIGAMISDGAAAWLALADDSTRGKYLRAATLFLDRQAWQGLADAQGGTTLQWPRSGVTNSAGVAVDSTTVPAGIVSACFEIAALFAGDPDQYSNRDAGSNIRAAGAGSARVEFFTPQTVADGSSTVLPAVADALVGQYLASSAIVMPSLASGTYGQSIYDVPDSDGNPVDDQGVTYPRQWPL